MDQLTLAGKRYLARSPQRPRLSHWLTICVLASVLTGCASSAPSSSQRVPAASSASAIGGNWVEVRRGDTLGQLAARADVPLERLERFNPGLTLAV